MIILDSLQIELPKNWNGISSENPEGPPTFINELDENSGALQISFAQYQSGTIPNPTYDDLISLSRNIGTKHSIGKIIKTRKGKCQFGIFGKVVFSSKEYPIAIIWHLSDKKAL
jgi:hypothetical protein